MAKFNDLTGQKFGRLTVTERANRASKHVYWHCTCDCGNKSTVRASHLTGNKIMSCGCLHKERVSAAKLKNLQGQRFGYLTVLQRMGIRISSGGSKYTVWRCVCDCGEIVDVLSSNLIRGNTTSCGCMKNKIISQRNSTHGRSGTRLYSIWSGMKNRCYNQNEKSYIHYGAKNITVCDEWKNNFSAFEEWALSNGYDDNLSIDRIDNSKGYCPGNCRWADDFTQQNNRTINRVLCHNGETHTVAEWARILGISADVIYHQIYKNTQNVEEVLGHK